MKLGTTMKEFVKDLDLDVALRCINLCQDLKHIDNFFHLYWNIIPAPEGVLLPAPYSQVKVKIPEREVPQIMQKTTHSNKYTFLNETG